MEANATGQRVHVPLTVHDALRRGEGAQALRLLKQANPGLDPAAAEDVAQRLGRGEPAGRLADDAPAASGALPPQTGALPTEVAAKLATGNVRDAARRLCDRQPGLSQAAALETVQQHASPLLRQAREETVVTGDSRQYGWVGWTLALLVAGVALTVLW